MDWGVAAVTATALVSAPVAAEDGPQFEPDMVFDFWACSTVATSLGAPSKKNDGFMLEKSPPHQTACARTGKKDLDCISLFEEPGAEPAVYKMRVKTELSQMIIIESESGGDFLIAKPGTGRVASTTRMVGETFFATKTCHGAYLTGDEFKAMAAKKKRTK